MSIGACHHLLYFASSLQWLSRDILETYLVFPKGKVANKGRKDEAKKKPGKKGKGESAYLRWDTERWNQDFPGRQVDLGPFSEFQYSTGVCDVPNGLFFWLPDREDQDQSKPGQQEPSVSVKVSLGYPTESRFITWYCMFKEYLLDQWSKNSQALTGSPQTAAMVEAGMGKATLIKKSKDANYPDSVSYRVPLQDVRTAFFALFFFCFLCLAF